MVFRVSLHLQALSLGMWESDRLGKRDSSRRNVDWCGSCNDISAASHIRIFVCCARDCVCL